MAKVTIYHKNGCPYCARAEALLQSKNVAPQIIEASLDLKMRKEMNEKSGRNTFPQIFINGKHVGGCDDLMALEAQGKLDLLLSA